MNERKQKMANRIFIYACLMGLGFGLSGCVQPGTIGDFKRPNSGGITRAAYELGCPENQMEVTDLGPETIGVAGCGKRAIYKYTFSTGWINNSGGEDAERRPAEPKHR